MGSWQKEAVTRPWNAMKQPSIRLKSESPSTYSISSLSQVTTRTLDPFSGVVYAGTSSLGGKGSPGCKVEGQGRHSLTIGVKVHYLEDPVLFKVSF